MNYSIILFYRGYCIIVENFIYKLQLNPWKTFLTMDDIKKEIENIEKNRTE